MNILHLPENYASLAFHQVHALALRGHLSRGYIYTSHPAQRGEGLRVFGRDWPFLYQKGRIRTAALRAIMLGYYACALPWADVLHWYAGGRVFTPALDMGLSRLVKSRKLVHWQGDDLRDPFLEADLNPAYAQACTKWTREMMQRQAKNNRECQLRFMDAGFTPLTPIDLEDHLLEEWRGRSLPIRLTVDTHLLTPAAPVSDTRIRIAHAPTNNVVKGTQYILDALEKLQKSYPIDIVLLSGMPRQKVMEAIGSSHIFIDNVSQGMFCMASLEALSMGVPTVCHVCERLQKKVPEDFPIVNTTAETLVDVLADLIARKETWPELARKGRAYVEKYHSYEVMGAYLEQIYERCVPV